MFKSYIVCVAVVVGLLASKGANAQVSSIDSVVVTPRVFNDVPGATFNQINSYPSFLALSEQNVSSPTGFANRDVWRFGTNNSAGAYRFQNGDYFHASMDLTLTGNPISPRKEAGFLFSTVNEGDIEFVVNTDGHEVVQFGGISFYSFSANNIVSYNSGDKITLSIDYFNDQNGKNALQFFANGNASPVFEFGPGNGSGSLDIGSGSTLGGYFQIVNDPANPNNSGSALFQDISVVTFVVPEPSAFALMALGILPLMFRRRR
jgi:hypothetical protein